MSQDLFEEVVAATSRDTNIDKGWTEIKTASGSKANVEVIFEHLQDIYWEGVKNEIAGAIVALADFDEYHSDALPIESPSEEELLSSENLAGLLNLWNPFGGVEWPASHTTRNQSKSTIDSVQKSVEENMTSFICGKNLRERRARGLLQALGLLDIDFVREHREPTFRSWGQRPQVDDSSKPLLKARQCSQCRYCIRSFHFYECVEGCVEDGHHRNRNMTKMQPLEKGTEKNGFNMNSMQEVMHSIQLDSMLAEKSPYRLCPTCLASSSHPREHLRAVRGFVKGGDNEAMEFARELDVWEDHLDGKSLLSLGTIAWDKLAMNGPRFTQTSSRHFFPAGNAHCALMFGPLIIENGMTKDPGGALISFRNTPNFAASSSKDLLEFLAEPSAWKLYNDEEVLHNTLYSVSKERRLYTASKPVKQRRFMSSRKQVSGGLFTGHCSRFTHDEEVIINEFTRGADMWKILKTRNGTQADHRNILNEIARRVMDMIKQGFNFEVNKYLLCFAERLEKNVNLQYNRMSNNCQDFCNAMLLNGDIWDHLVRFTYPPVPSNRMHESEHLHLRYMMSFAGKLLHPMDEMSFVNPLVSSVPLYESFGQNDADLIDHVASIRLRLDPHAYGMTLEAVPHDEFLLKDSVFTCPAEAKQSRIAESLKPRLRCTQASHLLDGPHDNLSVLTLHIHRPRSQYTVPSPKPHYDEFLSTRGASGWISNRLEILHRLLVLNTYLATITAEFQSYTTNMTFKELEKSWRPPSSFFARAWHSNKREGYDLEPPTWNTEIRADELASSTTAIAMLHTHPFMQEPYVWKTRMAAIKRRLHDELKDETGVFKGTPWTNCKCKDCVFIFAQQNCFRATSYAASQGDREPGLRKYVKSHPDYVSLERLQASIEHLEEGNTVVNALFRQLNETPEYLLAQ